MTDTELFDAIEKFQGSVRLSNKNGTGYWWCYLTPFPDGQDITEQASSPREALEKALAHFSPPEPPSPWEDWERYNQ